MKKHELLKFAYDNYPKGTKFLNLTTGKENVSVGSFEVGTFGITTSEEIDGGKTILCRYKDFKWAEIVNPKIAVKVENEKEFNALMKYYNRKGWFTSDNMSPLSLKYLKSDCEIIEFNDNFSSVRYSSDLYTVIPFSDFAKEHNIKLPLLTSKDGVDLYEGSKYYQAVLSFGKWELNIWKSGNPWILESDDNVVLTPEENKAFSTKESALKWIEEQKPKKLEVKLNCDKHLAIIDKDWVMLRTGSVESNTTVYYKHSDIEAIHKAMQELS